MYIFDSWWVLKTTRFAPCPLSSTVVLLLLNRLRAVTLIWLYDVLLKDHTHPSNSLLQLCVVKCQIKEP